MEEDPIPDDVRRFITKHIDSVAQMEAMMLLRADGGVDWGAEDVARRLYVRPDQAQGVLSHPIALGVVVEGAPGRFRRAPLSAEFEALVTAVTATYSRRLVQVTAFIHSKPKRTIQELADAFRIWKDR